jgi:ferric-dicitrate binding protein FerR (iron transport regulator)
MGTMTDTHDQAFPEGQMPADNDRIGQLLRLAGPREAVPPERALRVKAAVRARWRQQTRARSQRITMGWSLGALATAALVLVGVRLAVRDDSRVESPQPAIATLEILSGTVRVVPALEGGAAEPVSLQMGDSIRAGSSVDTTRGGRAALRLPGGVSVRIASDTRLTLVSQVIIILEEGAIYVHSGGGREAGALEVRTTLGVARDIGTRFEIRIDGSALRVRVREGLVQLTQGRQSHDAKAGDELTLNQNGGVVRRTVPVYGADWKWTVDLARPFELEGRSLRDFLEWICDENGWQLRFADSAVERHAETTILHGSIEGLTPEEALAAVLPTSEVDHQLANGVLRIWLSSAGTKSSR